MSFASVCQGGGVIVFQLKDGTVVHGLNQNEVSYLYQEIFTNRAYLPERGFDLSGAPVIFDVGANIGLFSLFALREWPHATVHAFEPIPQIHDVLRRNVAPRVHTHQVAVGDGDREARIVYYPNYTMMSGIRADPTRDRARVEEYAAGVLRADTSWLDPAEIEAVLANFTRLIERRFEPVEVPCRIISLTSVITRLRIDRIDLLKIDVEGDELDVVRGIDDATWPRVRNAVVEVDDRDDELALIDDLFTRHGFTTASEQLDGYQGSELHLLYAWR
jgi:31-O-methyltransferase